MPTKNKEDQIKHSNEKGVASPDKQELKNRQDQGEFPPNKIMVHKGSFNPLHPDEDQIKHSIDAKVPAYNWAPPERAPLTDRQQERLKLFGNPEAVEEKAKDAAKKFGTPNKLGDLNVTDIRAFAGPNANFHHTHPEPEDDPRSTALTKAVKSLKGDFNEAAAAANRATDADQTEAAKHAKVAAQALVDAHGAVPAEAIAAKKAAASAEAKASASLSSNIKNELRKAFHKHKKTTILEHHEAIIKCVKEGNKPAAKAAAEAAAKQEADAPSFKEAETFLKLELGFEVIVQKIYGLCNEINKAIAGGGDYEKAKNDYIGYLENLNNANPKGTDVNADEALGYGRALKWVFVEPVIDGGKIKAVTIVGEWVGGTHISSNGVALPDK